MKKIDSPPSLALRLLDRFSGRADDSGAAGDFEEYYRSLLAERGVRRARRECWRQVASAFPGYFKNSIIGSFSMLKHFFRVSLRNLRKHKGYSFINITGLAVGMACALLILIWVQDELSFDRFHANAESLYRLEQEQDKGSNRTRHSSMPYALGPLLKSEIPEIRDAVRIADPGQLLVRHEDKAFFEDGLLAVDPWFFGVFSFPLLEGDPATALGRPDSLVVTEDIAKKYFGGADPIGRTVTLNSAYAFTITGVMKNPPSNSTLSFAMLLPFDFVKTLGQYSDSLTANDILTYVRLHAQSDLAAVEGKIKRLTDERATAEIQTNPELKAHLDGNPEMRRLFEDHITSRRFILMPIVDIHRQSPAIRNVTAYSAIALFILLTACINFMNLATARSAGRAKEIGLRKVVGSQRKSLIAQFYGESILTAFLAAGVALLLAAVLLPAFNALSGKSLALRVMGGGKFLSGMLAVTLFTGIVAGSYPAVFLSAFRPLSVLQGRPGSGAKRAPFRKTLVLLQFSLSVFLLIGMGTVSRQVDYVKNKKLGYDKEQLIYLPMRDQAPLSYAVLKEKLLRNPRILGVTATRHPPTAIIASDTYADWDGRNPDLKFRISFASVDFDYPETMKIEMLAGRSFSPANPSDVQRAFLVNEGVPKLMGLDPPSAVGKRFRLRGYEGPIVGVLKDFHYQSVHNAIEPLAVVVDPKEFHYAVVRLTAGQIPASLEHVKETWRDVYPRYPLEVRFFDEDFDRMYREDERMGTILKVFSALAVLIACLGLFGLASYTAEQRTKEIGIRKVLGASSRGIVILLSKEFAACVLAANVIAWPAAYMLMRNWLQKFAYRATIAWWLFAAAGIAALAIAVLTVSAQAIRASRSNPVIALKYE